MTWKVKYFQTRRGTFPVKEFIEEQNKDTQTKIARYIRLLINYGPYIRPPYNKKIGEKLYELRISGKVAIRIFYIAVNNEYYLLHIFKKKSQKTPEKELEIALDRIQEII